jgi:hypothetical protein
MSTPRSTLIELETRFWQSLVEQDVETALEILNEPAVMVSGHGAMKFDHEGYRRMAEKGPKVLRSFELSDMQVVFPNQSTAVLTYRVKQDVAPRGQDHGTVEEMNDSSTWIKVGDEWQCVVHTETPAAGH